MRWARRLAAAAAVLLASTALVGAPAVRPAGAQQQADPVSRASGTDRYATAAAVSAASFPTGVEYAFVATGEAFPDALAGGAVAGAMHGPVLLTRRDSLPDVTSHELTRLSPARIVILGGPSAISDETANRIAGQARVGAFRIAGSDRYATAASVSRSAYETPDVPVAYVATGAGFADALSGGPSAAVRGGPLLLVAPGAVPAPTKDELSRLKPQTIVVLGGPTAVPEATLNELRSYASNGVTRLAGSDRYATAVAVSASSFDARPPIALLATGQSFPDALGGAPVGGTESGPLLLVAGTSVPESVWRELERLRPKRVLILGGPSAISFAVEEELRRRCSRGLCGSDALYSFIHLDGEGRPARWNPCKPIHYRVNLSRAPEGADADLASAMQQVESATGIDFVLDGTTAMWPGEMKVGDPRTPPNPPLIVAWTKPGDPGHPADSRHGDAAVYWYESPKGPVIYAGAVALDSTRPPDRGFDRGNAMGPLLLHELGHIVGLDHVTNSEQIMQAELGPAGPTSYGAGDRAGLDRLGASAGCIG